MGIKKEKDNTYTVSYHWRHPITRKSRSRRRTKIKSMAEAKRVRDSLVIEVDREMQQKVTPSWSQVVKEFLEEFPSTGVNKATL